jgi:hypothetical protein
MRWRRNCKAQSFDGDVGFRLQIIFALQCICRLGTQGFSADGYWLMRGC